MIVQVEYDISNKIFILHKIVKLILKLERLMRHQNIIIFHYLQ